MKKLLAHSKTKGELTTFLAKNVKDNANGGPVVVAGERNVRQRTWTSRIYKVHKKKPTRRFFHMLWMPLLKVLPNSLCWMYQPKTDIKTVKALRWSFFKKNQAESKRLPPTQAALHQAILRAHYQLLVWNNDHVANPMLSSPEGY